MTSQKDWCVPYDCIRCIYKRSGKEQSHNVTVKCAHRRTAREAKSIDDLLREFHCCHHAINAGKRRFARVTATVISKVPATRKGIALFWMMMITLMILQ